MCKPLKILAGLLLCAIAAATAPARAAPMKTEVKSVAPRRGAAVAPIPKDKATRSHAPFESGQCGVCHVKNDAANPGPIRHASVNEECFECHDDTREVMARKYRHRPAEEMCTDCHNPHNSTEPGLLAQEMVEQCLKCHAGIKNQLAKGKVQHDAVRKDKKCSNCHNPHASNIERMLIALPFNLCGNCHSRDGMMSADGKPMVNYKKFLEENKIWHDPVRA